MKVAGLIPLEEIYILDGKIAFSKNVFVAPLILGVTIGGGKLLTMDVIPVRC